MEAKSESEELEKKYNAFTVKAKLEETATGVEEALSTLADELKWATSEPSRRSNAALAPSQFKLAPV